MFSEEYDTDCPPRPRHSLTRMTEKKTIDEQPKPNQLVDTWGGVLLKHERLKPKDRWITSRKRDVQVTIAQPTIAIAGRSGSQVPTWEHECGEDKSTLRLESNAALTTHPHAYPSTSLCGWHVNEPPSDENLVYRLPLKNITCHLYLLYHLSSSTSYRISHIFYHLPFTTHLVPHIQYLIIFSLNFYFNYLRTDFF